MSESLSLSSTTYLANAPLSSQHSHTHPRCLRWEAWRASLRRKEKQSLSCCQAIGRDVRILHHRESLYQPAPQRFGPTQTLAALMLGRDQIDLPLCLPALTWPLEGFALISHIRAVSRQTSTAQPWRRCLASCKHGGSQMLIMCAGRAKASNDADRSDTE